MEWIYDDGGRAAAGFKGIAGDCACRAVTIACEEDYLVVYQELNSWGAEERLTARRRHRSSSRTGVHKHTLRRYLEERGWVWHPTMGIGTGCRVHLRAEELPSGRLICSLSKHVVAVIDGVVHDTYDPSRDGTRCVYGYFSIG